MSLLVPLLLQGSEWLIVIVIAGGVFITLVVIGLLVKLALAGAGALNRVGRNSPSSPSYDPSGSSPNFCGSCGTPLSPGLKFCPNCGKQL